MKGELLSAVHVELEQKTKRSNNVVIQGLPSDTGLLGSDIDHVRDFLNVEFCTGDQRLCVVSCKRLGRRQVKDTTETNANTTAETASGRKFPPLLVAFESSKQAKYVIENARKLRKSVCQYTRDHIFINPDMTAAESRAAYELRCRRRERRGARASAAGASDANELREGATTVGDVITAVLSSARMSGGGSDRAASTSGTSSQLNGGSHLDPDVEPFQPRSTGDSGDTATPSL